MNKCILTTILAIFLCISVITGATMALFSSQSKVDVAATAGKVSVLATAKDAVLSSTLGENLPETTYAISGSQITLNKIVPGDVLSFNIKVENKSNVSIKYRTVITKVSDTGLWDGLEVSIGGVAYGGETKVSKWVSATPGSNAVIIPVVITLPETAANDFQGESCSFAYSVEAVQGNMQVADAPNEESPATDNDCIVGNDQELATLGDKTLTGNNSEAKETSAESVADADVGGSTLQDKGIGTDSTLQENNNSTGTDKQNVAADGVDIY